MKPVVSPAALIPGYFGPAETGPPERPLVLQTVFYGDPGLPGKAGSGGIGSLVLRLGNALAEGGEDAATMACRYAEQKDAMPERERQTDGHVLFRLPVPVPDAAFRPEDYQER